MVKALLPWTQKNVWVKFGFQERKCPIMVGNLGKFGKEFGPLPKCERPTLTTLNKGPKVPKKEANPKSPLE